MLLKTKVRVNAFPLLQFFRSYLDSYFSIALPTKTNNNINFTFRLMNLIQLRILFYQEHWNLKFASSGMLVM